MSVEEKAVNLIKEGKVKKELETGKRVHFTIEGTDEKHSVIFDKKTQKFSCDCKWSTLKDKECSHILAAKFLKSKD
jgi:hypothetical protein